MIWLSEKDPYTDGAFGPMEWKRAISDMTDDRVSATIYHLRYLDISSSEFDDDFKSNFGKK